ncbi:MAG: amidohydrolase [Holophaga sp.]|nr:amidohydrolase [Holophaga sp.]
MEQRISAAYDILHAMPELGFKEFKTSAWLADQLRAAGCEVTTGVAGTGIVAVLKGREPGPVVGLRADLDALPHHVDGQEVRVHSCGHDAHCTMVLAVAEAMAATGFRRGTLKLLFQPGEETLYGATRMIEAGVLDGLDILLGIHLRPIQEARAGQATPALYHGACAVMEATLHGHTAHGARPHLGINAIDAAAAVIQAVNAINLDPVVPWSCKVTRLQAGGAANVIPDKAELALDLRAQRNDAMATLIEATRRAIQTGAATVGASAEVALPASVPSAEYDPEIIALARKAIRAVLGDAGLLDPVVSPGGDDFHRYVQAKPALRTGFIGLGCDLAPGLHDPAMHFHRPAMAQGVDILLHMVRKLLD